MSHYTDDWHGTEAREAVPVPAPMVQVPAETVEKLRELLYGSFAKGDPGTLRRMYGEVGVAALAVADAATPAASVKASGTPACRTGDLTAQVSIPAADILALADRWANDHDGADECETCWLIQQLRDLVAAAEQADKGEAADTPRDPEVARSRGYDAGFADAAERAWEAQQASSIKTHADPYANVRPAPAAPPEPQELFCTCGHGQSFHDTRTRTGIFCTGDEDCFCVVFAVATQAARVPVNDEAEAWDGTTGTEDAEVVNAIPPEMRASIASNLLLIVQRIAERHHAAGFRAARQGGNSDE